MNRRKFAIVLPSLVAVGACQTLPEEVGRTASPGDGKVVLSIGALRGGSYDYTAYSMTWRAVGGTLRGTVTYGPRSAFRADGTFPFSDEEGDGIVHLLSLPSGDYEIENYALQIYQPGIIRTFSARQPFSLKFTVRKGELTYVGRFLAQSFATSNALGFTTGNGGFYYWLTREESDIRIIGQRLPQIASFPSLLNGTKPADIPGSIKFLGAAPVQR